MKTVGSLSAHLLLSLVLSASLSAFADAPLPPPGPVTTKSANGQFMVSSIPEKGTTVIEMKTGRVLWSTPGWHRWPIVSDDGEFLLVNYGSLLPLDFKADEVVLTVWRKGIKHRVVRLKELVPDKSKLARTASHYFWGEVVGISAEKGIQIDFRNGEVMAIPLVSSMK